MAAFFPSCKVIVFLDADLLLLPPNAKPYAFPKSSPVREYFRRAILANGTLAEAPLNREPLHLQPAVSRFLLSKGTILASKAPVSHTGNIMERK